VRLKIAAALLGALLALYGLTIDAAQGEIVWFRFKKSFIESRYPTDVAFGSIEVSDLWKVGPAHYIKNPTCSGTDGEVHLGVYEEDLDWPGSSETFSFPVGNDKVAWGLVIEPPNVTAADMTALRAIEKTPATFDGYLRVWNEGHWNDEEEKEESGSSNPNHVLGLHPAWRVRSSSTAFPTRDFPVFAMANYGGYGLSKFSPVAQKLKSGDWLKVYQTSTSVYLSLIETSNFFTLPMIVRSVAATTIGAKLLTVDVCAERACSSGQFVLTGLRAVVVPSAEEGVPLVVGNQAELLGFFSVNLRAAMAGSKNAKKKSQAIVLQNALEFFVFGRAKVGPVKNSQCEPE